MCGRFRKVPSPEWAWKLHTSSHMPKHMPPFHMAFCLCNVLTINQWNKYFPEFCEQLKQINWIQEGCRSVDLPGLVVDMRSKLRGWVSCRDWAPCCWDLALFPFRQYQDSIWLEEKKVPLAELTASCVGKENATRLVVEDSVLITEGQ